MKDRVGYSPKLSQNYSSYDINYSKSPVYGSYDTTVASHEFTSKNNAPYSNGFKQFSKVKKISEDISSLRATMNYKTDRIKTAIYGEQSENYHKPNDFLRQTMNSKTTRANLDRNLYDTVSTKASLYKKEDFFQNYKTVRGHDFYQIPENKSAVNLIDDSSGFRDYEKLNQKIDRNKRLIQELRKTTGKAEIDSYPKSPTIYNKSPAYELDRPKQLEGQLFKKKKNEDSHTNSFTPKVDKSNYEYRVSSTPTIQPKKIVQKCKEESSSIGLSFSAITYVGRPKQMSIANRGNILQEFAIGKKLGEGKFGLVNLVIHKKTAGVFALKKIPKQLIKSHLMVDQLALQIRLQSSLRHRNVLGMYGFFDDATHLYIVLEYMEGGTLYQKLKKGKLCEKEAASVIKQMVYAIEYLHDLGIAHRDIKPENIVISNDVYKLCDFGWAALCNQRRKTYCGTFDYVAPEILQGSDYDMTVDLWCLGVMTFELLTGKAPFYHISRKQTMKKIMNTEFIEYPKQMSKDAKDLIDKLIRKNPLERIKASEALNHPFLIDADKE